MLYLFNEFSVTWQYGNVGLLALIRCLVITLWFNGQIVFVIVFFNANPWFYQSTNPSLALLKCNVSECAIWKLLKVFCELFYFLCLLVMSCLLSLYDSGMVKTKICIDEIKTRKDLWKHAGKVSRHHFLLPNWTLYIGSCSVCPIPGTTEHFSSHFWHKCLEFCDRNNENWSLSPNMNFLLLLSSVHQFLPQL